MSNDELIVNQYCELAAVFPALHMRGNEDHTIIYGTVSFSVHAEDGDIEDAFEIEIDIPPRYPEEIPTEIGRASWGERV